MVYGSGDLASHPREPLRHVLHGECVEQGIHVAGEQLLQRERLLDAVVDYLASLR